MTSDHVVSILPGIPAGMQVQEILDSYYERIIKVVASGALEGRRVLRGEGWKVLKLPEL